MIQKIGFSVLSIFVSINLFSQAELPPEIPWQGKSESIIVKADNEWITPAEKSNFKLTATYDETYIWFKKLAAAHENIHILTLNKSPEGRDCFMIVASSEKKIDPNTIANSTKPTLFMHAGIHAGEIDGKDAGMLLFRDMAFGSKKDLIEKANILFIPILNIDGHERISSNNRINQRGPENMGWRTNSNNLNLNRDFMKLETPGTRNAVEVLHAYAPDLYMDIHVTDGADYQYDITYGYLGSHLFSSNIVRILDEKFRPKINFDLEEQGHIPGPLMFAMNGSDFSEGTSDYTFRPAFSNAYGDIIHVPSILVENHSLKPFKQRVLGTYVLMESCINFLVENSIELNTAVEADIKSNRNNVVLNWEWPSDENGKLISSGKMKMKGIQSQKKTSNVTGSEYVQWTGEKIGEEIDVFSNNKPGKTVTKPDAYYIPAAWNTVLEKLKFHHIEMEILDTKFEVEVKKYRVDQKRFASQVFEGKLKFTGSLTSFNTIETYPPGTIKISTNQKLGDLIVYLLDPNSEESFFRWGYFNTIFSRTEYIEAYVMEPKAQLMLDSDPLLKKEFDEKKLNDAAFANDPQKILTWFYEKSGYIDQAYLIYPVGQTTPSQ